MSQVITLNVRDKIASCITEKPIVCGNSDYEIHFDFDEEWNGHEVKTAVFTVNGKSVLRAFSGTVCKIPELNNTLILWVGVFAGTIDDGTLSTSTPALIKCVPCATDGEHLPFPPPDDVYNQIVELCDEAVSTANDVKERADRGEFNGTDGIDGKDGTDGKTAYQYAVDGGYEGSEEDFARDTANLTNAKESAEQAASNASTSAESAQESADRANDILEDVIKEADAPKRYTNNVFANALKGHKTGQSVSADDVSPIEHELDVRVRSKNIISLPYNTVPSTKPAGLNIVYNEDGGITVSGKNTNSTLFEFALFTSDILLTGDLFISGCPVGGSNDTYRIMISTVNPSGAYNYFADNGNGFKVNKGYTLKNISIRVGAGYDFGDSSVTFYPQAEFGTSATAYVPYIDVEGINVTVTDGESSQTATADVDGNVSGLMSVSPSMTLATDNDSAVIDCTYNRDINKAFEQITQAMVSMGANI